MDDLEAWYEEHLDKDFMGTRRKIASLLQEESKLMDIVKLVGADILPEEQKLVLEIAKLVRVGFLQQNAFHDVDTYVPIEKQYMMMKIILYCYKVSSEIVTSGIPISQISKTGLFEEIVKIKYDYGNEEEDIQRMSGLYEKIDVELTKLKDSYKNFERKHS
jgi:V/A-type H+-transporting ATPase subunit A